MERKTIDIIIGLIEDVLPVEWERVIFRAIISEGYYSMYFYVYVNGKYIQCYNLPGNYDLTEKEINDTFSKIYKLCKDERREEGWTALTLVYTKNKKFTMDFEYDTSIEKHEWKKKYGIE